MPCQREAFQAETNGDIRVLTHTGHWVENLKLPYVWWEAKVGVLSRTTLAVLGGGAFAITKVKA